MIAAKNIDFTILQATDVLERKRSDVLGAMTLSGIF